MVELKEMAKGGERKDLTNFRIEVSGGASFQAITKIYRKRSDGSWVLWLPTGRWVPRRWGVAMERKKTTDAVSGRIRAEMPQVRSGKVQRREAGDDPWEDSNRFDAEEGIA